MQQATVSRSASICVICTPVSCQYLGRIRISGRKKMPCLAEDRKVAVQYFPMDWNSMLAMTLMGSSTRDTHWQRSAKDVYKRQVWNYCKCVDYRHVYCRCCTGVAYGTVFDDICVNRCQKKWLYSGYGR